MATMFPENLLEEILNDEKRSGEILVYYALHLQLDDSYKVYYSSPWLGIDKYGMEIDGEADFIVAHRDLGILIIEVKGGGIVIENNTWYSRDRYGIDHKIKNPCFQAKNSKYQLLKKLERIKKHKPHRIPISHFAIMPHSEKPAHDLTLDCPLSITAYSDDISDLGEIITAKMRHVKENDRSSTAGMDLIINLDKAIITNCILKMKRNISFESDMKNLEFLTNDQIMILNGLRKQNKMKIAGAAGTGKTVLALKKAELTADEDETQRILLICYNQPLAEYLKKTTEKYPSIDAMNYHQLCSKMANQNNKRFDPTENNELFLHENLIGDFASCGHPGYDAIIVDEGQDFKTEWMQSLEMLLKDQNSSMFYIFYDNNQNVMSVNTEYMKKISAVEYDLMANVRNTRQIFRQAKNYYAGGEIFSKGPQGDDVDFYKYNEKSFMEETREKIFNLIVNQGVRAVNIAVLVDDASLIEKNREFCFMEGQKSVSADKLGDGIIFDTVRRFKGLERQVVILAITRNSKTLNECLYTGITRAQVKLIVFIDDNIKNQVFR